MSSRLPRAALLLALALGALLRATPPHRAEDLRPRPDALEYEEAARSLAAGEGYALRIGDERYPPRFPPGFALLLAPYYRFVDDAPGAGVVVVWATALVAIAGAAALGFKAGGAWSGVVAAAVVALSPLHVRWSRAVMSDVPASAALVWLAVWVVAALRRGARGGEWLALGLAIGLALHLRVSVGVVALPALALLVAAGGGTGTARRGDPRPRGGGARAPRPGIDARGVAFVCGLGLGAASIAVVNGMLYGSPLRSGYDYWAPGSYFSLRYLLGPALGSGTSVGGNVRAYLEALLGFGRLYPWPVGVLAALGAVAAWRAGGAANGGPRAVAVVCGGAIGGLVALHAPYFWQWDRFFVPAVPLAAALAGAAFAEGEARPWRVAVGSLAALALGLLAWSADDRPPDPVAFDVRALRAIDAAAGERALVVADTNPFFFARLLRGRGDRTWLPLAGDEHLRVIEQLHRVPLSGREALLPPWRQPPIRTAGDIGRALDAIAAALAEGREAYVSRQWDVQVPFMDQFLERLREGYELEPLPAIDPDPDAPAVYRVRARSPA